MRGAWRLGRLGRRGPELTVTPWAVVAAVAIGVLAARAVGRAPFTVAGHGGPDDPFGLLAPGRVTLLPSSGWAVAGGVAVAIVVLGSILAHELGHLAGARLAGVRVTAIDLTFYGGLASWEDGDDRRAGQLAAIAAGGPAVTATLTLAFGVAALALGPATSAAVAVADRVAGIGFVVNAAALAVNFVPAHPLDGALLLRALRLRRAGR